MKKVFNIKDVLTKDINNKHYWIEDKEERDYYAEKNTSLASDFNNVIGLAKEDDTISVNMSTWPEIYGSEFRLFELNEQVGFDHCKFGVSIEAVDLPKLDCAIQKYERNNYKTLPRVRVLMAKEGSRGVILPNGIKSNFTKIEITLSPYETFVFQKNNANKDGSKFKSDIYYIDIRVRPDPEHKMLGNIFNYSYEQMKGAIYDAIESLYDLTGIKVSKDIIILKDIELNLTFRQKCDFDELKRALSYYQLELNGYYQNSEFSYAGQKKLTNKLDDKVDARIFTGFRSSSKSVTMTLYDKARETILAAQNLAEDKEKSYRKIKARQLVFEDKDALIRLEFRINVYNELIRYFGTVLYSDLDQVQINLVFMSLVDKFFIKTYDLFGEKRKATIKRIASEIGDNAKYNNQEWKTALVRMILAEEIFTNKTPSVFNANDMIDIILEEPRFCKKKSYYRKIIIDLFEKNNIYDLNSDGLYKIIMNFFCKAYFGITRSKKRRIGYIVESDRTRQIEEEIRKSLF